MSRVLLAIVLVLLVGAAPAAAQTLQLPGSTATGGAVGQAMQALRAGETVYVAPDARDALPQAQAQQVASQIAQSGSRIYVAVLPEDTAGTNLAMRIGRGVERDGTYVVAAGDRWSAASNQLDPGEAPRIVDDAARERAGDTAGVLGAFVRGVDEADDAGAPGGLLAVLAVIAGGGGLLAWRARRRRRAQEEAELEELRETANEDLVALGEDVRALDLDVDMPGADPRGKQRYGEAVQAYTRAEEALDFARRPEDFEPIGQALEEGRWAMEAAKAHLAGRGEPERRPPCFFDPRHGPSVTDMEWSPGWGAPRQVPVCAADAVRLEEGEEPASREVLVGGERVPYWQAPGAYGPYYAGGMFGGFGGFLPGLLFGSMLGSGFGFGFPDSADAAGGDWGGGDFGGGDFGGGDFGGGDFG
jgi:hypothetical protein